ncbi:MAG: hypothetical protein DMD95_08545, partial [Candidatus Rokuibacteriota bacterium]
MLSALVVAVLVPAALLTAVLLLSTWRARTRLLAIGRQISVTDAIHEELGAVVSPVVRHRLWGRWQLMIPVPFDDLDTVTHVVRTAYGAFDAPERTKPGRFEIVLSQQERPVPRRERTVVA